MYIPIWLIVIVIGVGIYFYFRSKKRGDIFDEEPTTTQEMWEQDDVGKMFGDAFNEMTDKEMEKLTPAQRAEAEKFGEEFSEEFKKLNPSEQEKVWNSFADALKEQKNKEWHEEWDKKLKETGIK